MITFNYKTSKEHETNKEDSSIDKACTLGEYINIIKCKTLKDVQILEIFKAETSQ